MRIGKILRQFKNFRIYEGCKTDKEPHLLKGQLDMSRSDIRVQQQGLETHVQFGRSRFIILFLLALSSV